MRRIDHTGKRFGKLVVEEMMYGYRHKKTYAKCRCDCGNETIVCVCNLVKGATKSCGCFEEKSRFGRPNHEKKLLHQKFGHLTVIEKTEKRCHNGSVLWKCSCDCGNIVEVSSGNLLRGKTRSCGCNKISKYEEIVQELLEENEEPYIREHEFVDCKNVYPLKFDFYLPNRNVCIECQGRQHYQPVDFFGGVERHKTVVHNDEIKRKYCDSNNIVLMCLPYTLSRQEVRTKVLSILNPCND